MKVFVVYDPLREIIREVHSKEQKAYNRCDELDKIYKNDIACHVAEEFEIID